ncbi:ureidoglycolate lyase [Cupriavidus basilensis]|uniref:Ureidoglycolate lyase n=1 Tax=Cupriavidus basilensis TaxID=68895 RepID=A0A643FUV6_9BURK|nr:ureidoglycolate lyase [Cupriavidus basilensis]QOT79282.1 ureidoglycolate lyase [Cupriavidus basilensis]
MSAPDEKAIQPPLPSRAPVRLQVEPLTVAAFAPFGDVIESEGRAPMVINGGMTLRYDDLASVDVGTQGGRALISFFDAQPYALPLGIRAMERHPLGSQAFVPLDEAAFLVVVAPVGDQIDESAIRVYVTNGRQGVNYKRGTWHHSLIVTQGTARFLVVDRGGEGHNCDVIELRGNYQVAG